MLDFGTHVTIKANCKRHELKSAFVRTDHGNAYDCVFPFRNRVQFARVYPDEIAEIGTIDQDTTMALLQAARNWETART